MDSIVGVLGAPVTQFKFSNDDDSVDKLSHRYTVILFIIFSVIVSTKQYVGNPIDCWVPAHFTGNHEAYTNSYCWIKNTYYLPLDDHIPKAHEDDKRRMIPYYQWIPLILLSQALMFYLPRMAWRGMNGRTAIDVDNVVEQAESFQNTEKADDKDKTLENMVKQMDRFLRARETYKQGGCTLSLTDCLSRACCPVCGRHSGNYLTLTYLLCKFIYIANVLGQLFLLDVWLGHDFHFYGLDVLKSLFEGNEDWRDSPRFPRVTMCDFKVRRLGNVQRYTVQCVLSINLFNEMIYLFVWFWLIFVSIMTVLSLLRWALRSLSQKDRTRYVKKHLGLMEKFDKNNQAHTDHFGSFMNEYLKSDGVFILRLVGHNTDAVTVTEVICALWDHYLQEEQPSGVPGATNDESHV